jgi:hypothetical protein
MCASILKRRSIEERVFRICNINNAAVFVLGDYEATDLNPVVPATRRKVLVFGFKLLEAFLGNEAVLRVGPTRSSTRE